MAIPDRIPELLSFVPVPHPPPVSPGFWYTFGRFLIEFPWLPVGVIVAIGAAIWFVWHLVADASNNQNQ